MKAAIQELEQLLYLTEVERQAEIAQYQSIIKETPLQERKNKGLSWYPITIVKERIGLGEQLQLDIERTTQQGERHTFREGQTAALFVNMPTKKQDYPSLHGVIEWVRGDKLRLTVNVDELPDWIDDGKLGLNKLYNETTFKAMKTAVKTAIAAKDDRLAELRNILLGYAPAYFPTNAFAPTFPDLNKVQNQAVQLIATAQDVAIVHGPPGTGKTTTLVKAIVQTLKSEKQVLVCAPSNTAVDLLTQKLTEQGLNVVRIGHPARVDDTLLAHTLDAQIANHGSYKQLKQYRKDAQQIRKKALKYKRVFGKEERLERRALLQDAKDMKYQAYQLEKYILKDVVDTAQVITATMTGAAKGFLTYKIFSTVFIDESSQALEAAMWIPISNAQRVVMAGDHCQLPPTVKTSEAQRGGLMVSLFEKCIDRCKGASVMLQTQYRMHEHIMGFSSQEFYNNELVADESVKNHVLGEDALELLQAVEFIDTAGCGFEEAQNPKTLSIFNDQEAAILLKQLMAIFTEMENTYAEIPSDFSVGLIAPYREQVRFLEKELPNYPLLQQYAAHISINTVDGFQGQERDLIAISMVRSNGDGNIGFLSDIRRMNVAMTRAKKKLLIVGDSATLAVHPFYERFLDYIEQLGAYRSAWEFV